MINRREGIAHNITVQVTQLITQKRHILEIAHMFISAREEEKHHEGNYAASAD